MLVVVGDIIGTRGLGGQGVSKIGAIIQGGRIGLRFAKKGYSRYFNYATKTTSRTRGTATGAGIGLSGGIVALQTSVQPPSYQNGQTRSYMVKSKSRRFKRRKCPTMVRYPKRRQRQFY